MKSLRTTCWKPFFICALAAFAARAEETADTPAYRPFNVSLEAGSTGAGGTAAWRFADHFGIRGGMDYFAYSRNSTIEDIPYNANLRMMSQMATINLFPSKKSSFFISVGAYFNQNRLTGTSDQGFTVNGITYPANQVGVLHLKCTQQPVNPYASLGGNLYFDKARHWSLGGELGIIYTGEPRVSLARTGGISDVNIDNALEQEKQMVEDKIKNYKFLPVLKISVNFSF